MNKFDLRFIIIKKIHKYIKRLNRPIMSENTISHFCHIFFYEGNNIMYITESICDQLFNFIGKANE